MIVSFVLFEDRKEVVLEWDLYVCGGERNLGEDVVLRRWSGSYLLFLYFYDLKRIKDVLGDEFVVENKLSKVFEKIGGKVKDVVE